MNHSLFTECAETVNLQSTSEPIQPTSTPDRVSCIICEDFNPAVYSRVGTARLQGTIIRVAWEAIPESH